MTGVEVRLYENLRSKTDKSVTSTIGSSTVILLSINSSNSFSYDQRCERGTMGYGIGHAVVAKYQKLCENWGLNKSQAHHFAGSFWILRSLPMGGGLFKQICMASCFVAKQTCKSLNRSTNMLERHTIALISSTVPWLKFVWWENVKS